MRVPPRRLPVMEGGLWQLWDFRLPFGGIADSPLIKIGFRSFGHWTSSFQTQTRSVADVLLQSIDLAVAAKQLGADGAFFRVHHFARQLASPFPLLAVVGAKTSRIEDEPGCLDVCTTGGVIAGSQSIPGGSKARIGGSGPSKRSISTRVS